MLRKVTRYPRTILTIGISLAIAATLSAQVADTGPRLIVTATLTRHADTTYQAVVTIANTGSGAANNLWLKTASLGSAAGSPTSQPLASLQPGSSLVATVDFPPNSGQPGSQAIEKFAGSYDGGTYGGSFRVMLPQTVSPPPTVSSSVDITQPGTPIPSHFLGFSMDSVVVDNFVGPTTTANPILVNLINNFTPYNGIPSLRPAATPASSGSSNISAKFLTALTALENGTHAPLIVTIGAGTYNPTYAANVAASVTRAIGTGFNGLQFELGNEPDQLARQGYRPSTYSFSDYLAEYQGYESAVAPYLSGKNAAGMASGSTTWDSNNDVDFLSAEASSLGVMTSHEYPLTACSGLSSITITHLLSDNISNAFYRRFAPIVALAKPYGVPVRAGEMNSVSCSGVAGVSDTFASSLWLLDSLFQLDLSGAAGMNLHTGSSGGVPRLPYNAFYVNGSQVEVHPIYYGMLMFAEATQNGGRLIPATTTVTGTQNVKVWGTLDASGKARITVIEKDTDNNAQTVSIDLGRTATAIGQLGQLQTTSSAGVAATGQVIIHGQTFDGTTDGHILGQPVTSAITPVNGVYTFTVPDGSAATLTVQF